jgi:hypothetical protein
MLGKIAVYPLKLLVYNVSTRSFQFKSDKNIQFVKIVFEIAFRK